MISLFRSKQKPLPPLVTDLHSHLLPSLDDGVKSFDESLAILRKFGALGYRKVITTPHINNEYYRNEPAQIESKLKELKELILQEGLSIEVLAAAEYYLDEDLIAKVNSKESLLTFSKNYLLFETNFLTEPYQLKEFIFQLITQGYKPVMAHPERYAYMTLEKASELRDRGVLLQVNIPSMLGLYSKPIQHLAARLIDNKLVDLIGSDCHNLQHAISLEKAAENKIYRKALELPLLNNTL